MVRYEVTENPKISNKPCYKTNDSINSPYISSSHLIIYLHTIKGKTRACLGHITVRTYFFKGEQKRNIYRSCYIRWDGDTVWHYQPGIKYEEVQKWVPRLQEALDLWHSEGTPEGGWLIAS